jgi:hypothetical protein
VLGRTALRLPDRDDLVDLLVRVWCLDDYSDVNDGDDGQPRPNRAMSLLTDVEQMLEAMGEQ